MSTTANVNIEDFPELNIFGAERVIKRPFTSYEYQEYTESGGSSKASLRSKRTDLRIRMTDRDMISYLSDAYLHIKYRILRYMSPPNSATINPVTQGKVAPVNSIWSLFRRAQFLMNREIISDIDDPGYVHHINGLINYSQDYLDAKGSQQLFIPDRGNGGVNPYQIFNIAFRNATTPTNDPGVLNIAGADPNVIRHSQNANADDDVLIPVLVVGNYRFDLTVEKTSEAGVVSTIQLLSNGAPGANTPIDYAGIADGDVIKFYYIDEVGNKQFVPLFNNASNKYITLAGNTGANITAVEDPVRASASVQSFFDFRPYQKDENFNSGFEERRLLAINNPDTAPYTTEGVISAYAPIKEIFGIFKDEQTIWKGTDLEFVFDLADDKDILFRDANVNSVGGQQDCIVRLEHMALWVPIIKPVMSIDTELMVQLNKNSLQRTLIYDEHNHYISDIRASNQTQGDWLIQTTQYRPTRCVVFFMLDEKRGNQTLNNMIFDNLRVERIQLRINSANEYPDRAIEVQFYNAKSGGTDDINTEGTDYRRAYQYYLKACYNCGNTKPTVSYKEFRDLYPIFVFDLEWQPDAVWANTSQAHIVVNYKLEGNVSGGKDYRLHAILTDERETRIKGMNGRLIRVQ